MDCDFVADSWIDAVADDGVEFVGESRVWFDVDRELFVVGVCKEEWVQFGNSPENFVDIID